MTREEIIQGLQFTIDMFLFDPNTGETFAEPRNDMDKTTIDSCKGAIKKLQDNSYELWKESYEVEHERNIRLEEKIKALEQQPCERFEWGIDGKVYKITKAKDGKEICQQVCDDAISCEAVIKWLKAKDIIKLSSQEETARKELKALPPVTPQKYGHWIWNFDKGYCKCSECGIGMGHKEFDYCPNCGAKMQESEEV